MKGLAVVLVVSFLIPSLAMAARNRQSADDVYVGGYTRRDGTYVQPHYRSRPNANKWDNYNYQPSQPQYNPASKVNRSSNWYQPHPGRLNDSNPYNDSPSQQKQWWQ